MSTILIATWAIITVASMGYVLINEWDKTARMVTPRPWGLLFWREMFFAVIWPIGLFVVAIRRLTERTR